MENNKEFVETITIIRINTDDWIAAICIYVGIICICTNICFERLLWVGFDDKQINHLWFRKMISILNIYNANAMGIFCIYSKYPYKL